MAKYKSILTKPIVDAVMWDGNTISETTEWTSKGINKIPMPEPGAIMRFNLPTGNIIHVGTSNGVKIANPGDYIVRHHDGEVLPWPKDAFEAIYTLTPNQP